MRFCLILLFSYTLTVAGQGHKPIIKLYGTTEGLSNNSIKDLVKDRKGFLWIATQTGLNRFDGVEFKQYYHQPGNFMSLPSSQINKLQLAPDGHIIAILAKE